VARPSLLSRVLTLFPPERAQPSFRSLRPQRICLDQSLLLTRLRLVLQASVLLFRHPKKPVLPMKLTLESLLLGDLALLQLQVFPLEPPLLLARS